MDGMGMDMGGGGGAHSPIIISLAGEMGAAGRDDIDGIAILEEDMDGAAADVTGAGDLATIDRDGSAAVA